MGASDAESRRASRRGTEPQRTCVGCRQTASRSALVRLVARREGGAAVDPGGAQGRGAYVHRDERCVERARRRLAGALRVKGIDFEAIKQAVLTGGGEPRRRGRGAPAEADGTE